MSATLNTVLEPTITISPLAALAPYVAGIIASILLAIILSFFSSMIARLLNRFHIRRPNLTPQITATACICLSAIALTSAYVAQDVFGIIPRGCNMCIQQRIAYWNIIFLNIPVFFITKESRRLLMLLGTLSIFFMLDGMLNQSLCIPSPSWMILGEEADTINTYIYLFMIALISVSFFKKSTPKQSTHS